jgi:LysM repeat protein
MAAGCQHLPWSSRSAAPTPATPAVEYRAKPGDTIDGIAAWYGAEASEVRRLNDLDDDDELAANQLVHVPARTLTQHRVGSGETLGIIGQRYGADVEALIHLNDIADVRKLQIGQRIQIPANAKRQTPSALPRTVRAPPVPATPNSAEPPPPREPPADASPETRAQTPPEEVPESVASPPPAPAPADVELIRARAEFDRAMAQATHQFEAADFAAALATAEQAQTLLRAAAADAADRRRLADAQLLSGMAHVALGRNDEARDSFREALAFDETIRPDPERASPTIDAAFQEAREPAPER